MSEYIDASLEALPDGGTTVIPYLPLGAAEITRRARSYARQRGFSTRLHATHAGIVVQRLAETERHTIAKALDYMADGAQVTLAMGALAMPSLRNEIGRRNDTGLVRYEAELMAAGIRVQRRDLFDDSQLRAGIAGLESLLGNTCVAFAVDAVAEAPFRARLGLAGMLIHQPLAMLRVDAVTVEAFYDVK